MSFTTSAITGTNMEEAGQPERFTFAISHLLEILGLSPKDTGMAAKTSQVYAF
jgi:hypothetical protein